MVKYALECSDSTWTVEPAGFIANAWNILQALPFYPSFVFQLPHFIEIDKIVPRAGTTLNPILRDLLTLITRIRNVTSKQRNQTLHRDPDVWQKKYY